MTMKLSIVVFQESHLMESLYVENKASDLGGAAFFVVAAL